ncbi:cellulase family glycosylhydrolase, partial [Streptomyces glaucescens]|uniref:cellulase family glycosylhydrolase n=1 Tax=Streptomyces glaucescens TaxID=1907 RepID=UPI003BB57142
MLNIGNEPHGNGASGVTPWTAGTKNAIGRMRAVAFGHTLMVDAPNWGQDWSFTMRDHAAEVFAADPAKDTVLSVHMYGVFNTADNVKGLPQPVHFPASSHRRRGIRRPALGRQYGRGTSSCPPRSSSGWDTSAGHGAATAPVSSTWTWPPAST